MRKILLLRATSVLAALIAAGIAFLAVEAIGLLFCLWTMSAPGDTDSAGWGFIIIQPLILIAAFGICPVVAVIGYAKWMSILRKVKKID
jgi:hypothetical protein